MKEEASRRSQQKAIDGILHDDPKASVARVPERRRFRSSARPTTVPPRPARAPVRTPPVPSISPAPIVVASKDELPPINMDLEDGQPTSSKKTTKKAGFFRRKWQAMKQWSWRKKLLVGFLLLLVLVLIAGGVLFLKGYFNTKKVFKGGGSAVSLQKEVTPDLLKGEGDGRINILLLGIGGEGHEAPDLTDTIIIASLDPVSHKIALLSIPRDLWVSVSGHGSMKLNAVYETGKYAYLGKQDTSNANQEAVKAGFDAVDKTLEETLGIPIHYHSMINFRAFQQAVDTVGGITVDVPERLYDPTMAWQNGGNPVLAEKGVQQFDGRKALMYVRSRYTTSDFARSQRQRSVIIALQQKILSLGTLSDPFKISQLMDAFGNNVVTDLSLKDVSRLYQLGKNITPDMITSVGLTEPPNDYLKTSMVGNQSVVIPKAGVSNYAAIQSFVRNTLRDGYLAKENALVNVLNGTATPNLATTTADVLKSYGYAVGVVGDAPTKTYKKTTIVDLTNGKKPYTAQYLKKRFKVDKVVTKLPDSTIQPQNADFVIILGEDESTSR